ncbi:PilZ domain-containing protein [Spongisporangium articulatum]|uniref:PilZ domain-containing protein n=1 Tax=Spongisporangium articulatum TaxID=3362603 RepID=A0ABW8APC5_9ACTN
MSASTPATTDAAEDDGRSQVRVGQNVVMSVYGESIPGRIVAVHDAMTEMRVLQPQAAQVLGTAAAEGEAVVALAAAALVIPVVCWAVGDRLRWRARGQARLLQRRKHQRVGLDVATLLSWREAAGSAMRRVVCRTADLSEGGVRLQPASVVWPSVGSRVTVTLDLADGPAHVAAEVLGTTEDYGLRLRFSPGADVAAVREAVERVVRSSRNEVFGT